MSSISATRLTRKTAARMLRTSPDMVRYYEHQGLLNGELDGRRMKYPSREIEALKARNATQRPEILARPDGVYLSGRAACKLLGVAPTWLYAHAKATFHLSGAGVPTHRERGILWYRKAEIEQIRASMKARRIGRFTINMEDYLGIRTVQRVLRINPQTVYWLDRTGRVKTHLVRIGWNKEAKVYREACLKEYLRKRVIPFDGIYENGRINLARAAKLTGRSHGEIGLWIRRGWLSSEKQAPPLMRCRTVKEHTVSPDELQKLVATLDSALRQGRPVGSWKKIEELVRLLAIKGVKARAELLRSLAPGIANGQIRTFRSDYPTEHQGTTKRRRLYYHFDDVKRFLFSAPMISLAQPVPKRGQPGRKHDPCSLRIQCFCCLEREKSPPTKMPTIRLILQKIFGVDSPINANGDVRAYKNRWINYRLNHPEEANKIEVEHFPQTLENYAKNR
jgi:hypothetical protein